MAGNNIDSVIYPGVNKFYYLNRSATQRRGMSIWVSSFVISLSAWYEKIEISMHVQPCIGCYCYSYKSTVLGKSLMELLFSLSRMALAQISAGCLVGWKLNPLAMIMFETGGCSAPILAWKYVESQFCSNNLKHVNSEIKDDHNRRKNLCV